MKCSLQPSCEFMLQSGAQGAEHNLPPTSLGTAATCPDSGCSLISCWVRDLLGSVLLICCSRANGTLRASLSACQQSNTWAAAYLRRCLMEAVC